MKGVILSHENNGVYVLDTDGSFRFVRGFQNRAVGDEIELPAQRTAAATVLRYAAAAAVLVVAVLVSLYAYMSNSVLCYVAVDINPGLELAVNRLGQVKNAKALNSDGAELLGDVRTSGGYVETLARILGTAEARGYVLSADDGLPCVSVTVASAKADRREGIASDIISGLTENGYRDVSVITCGEDEREHAQEYGVSAGRLRLANELLSRNPEYAFAALTEMPVHELFLRLEQTGELSVPPPAASDTEDGAETGSRTADDSATGAFETPGSGQSANTGAADVNTPVNDYNDANGQSSGNTDGNTDDSPAAGDASSATVQNDTSGGAFIPPVDGDAPVTSGDANGDVYMVNPNTYYPEINETSAADGTNDTSQPETENNNPSTGGDTSENSGSPQGENSGNGNGPDANSGSPAGENSGNGNGPDANSGSPAGENSGNGNGPGTNSGKGSGKNKTPEITAEAETI